MNKPSQKPPRFKRIVADGTHVSDFLAGRTLVRCITADFARLTDVEAFWGKPEFEGISGKSDRDRLSLENVVSRIEHFQEPKKWLKEYAGIESGQVTMAAFVRKIIGARK